MSVFGDDSGVRELEGDVCAIGARPDASAIAQRGRSRQRHSDYVTRTRVVLCVDKPSSFLLLLLLWLWQREYLLHQLGDMGAT